MTPPHPQSAHPQPDSARRIARSPVPARAPQPRPADNRSAADIDAAEFWRRLGL